MAIKQQGFYQDILDDVQKHEGMTFLGTGQVYAIQSNSDPKQVYYVMHFGGASNALLACTCLGFSYTDHCKHIKRVKEMA